MLEPCYICHQPVKIHEYNRHLRSHSSDAFRAQALRDIGIRSQPDATLPAYSYDTIAYDHYEHDSPLHGLVPITANDYLHDTEDFPLRLDPVDDTRRTDATSTRDARQETRERSSTQLDAFQLWFRSSGCNYIPYTTIDGQKDSSDSGINSITRTAQVLRGTTKEEVVKIVNDFLGFSGSQKEACIELVRKVPIFPGLVAYTYTHLIMCPRRGWFSSSDWSDRVSDLQRLVERWRRDGDIECILSCDTVKKRLLDLLCKTKVGSEDHKCNPALLKGATVLDCDIHNLAALAVLCIIGPQKNCILNQHGGQAEKLVELFHDLLEADVESEEWYRRYFFDAIILFSKESGRCPRAVYLTEGTIHGLVQMTGGGFGCVFKGMIGSRLVAVKVIKRGGANLSEYNKLLSKEAVVWWHLRNPNCLPLYGVYNVSAEGPDISVALVSPWMEQGTLSKYLERNPKANRTRLMLDVVRGLDYLHSMEPHVAHRDIKPDNILITRKGRACLADFGLISAFDTDDHFRTATDQIVMGGTCNYMAPEIFDAKGGEAKREVNKRACDMYALGCTVYAAYTGRPPFHGMNALQVYIRVTQNRRPDFPEGRMSPDMWSFVQNLWGPDPSKRLTAQAALGWMKEKAYQEGVDSSPAPFEDEWRWRRPRDDKCLWSVSI